MKRDEIDRRFMAEALEEAKKAARKGEVPVGAVIVRDGRIIARGSNRKESSFDPTGHAEVLAIRKATNKLKNWRLRGATLYATLEPCFMCMGAMVHARVWRLVFASFDPKQGACGSLYDMSMDERLNHRVRVTSGVMGKEAGELLKSFFSKLRKKRK